MPDIKISAQIWALLQERLIAAHPSLAEDDQALSDTLSGECDLPELAERLSLSARRDEALASALEAMIDEMAERQKRFLARAQSKKDTLLYALQEAGITKALEMPSATIGLAKVPPSVRITDEAKLDYPFRRLRHEIVTDKRALAEALKAGQVVPGAELSNGGQRLNVQVR